MNAGAGEVLGAHSSKPFEHVAEYPPFKIITLASKGAEIFLAKTRKKSVLPKDVGVRNPFRMTPNNSAGN